MGKRTIRTSVKKAKANASVVFSDVPSGCAVTYNGKVKFDIPLGTGAIEGILLDIVFACLDELETLGNGG